MTVDPASRTIKSSGAVRWRFGSVQFMHAPFTWHLKPLHVSAKGAVHSLAFAGTATLSFTAADGGTASLATELTVPAVAGGVSGDAVLRVSRLHGFNVRKVHVAVSVLPLGRLVLRELDFTYDTGIWSADAAVRLPAFTGSTPTLAGHLELANRKLRNIGVAASGLSVPLGAGFILTKASFGLGLGPLVIQGSGAATYGPPIAGKGPLLIVGKLQYSSVPERWEATGTVSLPWGIPGTKPSTTVGLQIEPGHAMTFTGDLDLSVHGWGLKGHLDGFASATGFNAEGSSTLKLPILNLGGTTLVSSKGMAACGKIQLLFLGKKLGFGYTWGGSLDVMGSSCDVGRYRVMLASRTALAIAPQTIVTSSPAGFAIFAAQGGDFTVSGPTGTFSSTPDRDDPTAFATHDTSNGWAYLAIPVTTTDAAYTVSPVTPDGPLSMVSVATGLNTHAGTGDVTAFVSGTGSALTLNYGIATDQFAPGETVSFYQGASTTLAGAEPIVEDQTTSNTAAFAPEPLGPATRAVFAVVSIDGRPREEFQVASFEAPTIAPPSADVFIQTTAGGWTVTLGKPQGVASWQVRTSADDGRRDWSELAGTASSFVVPAGAAKQANVSLTPLDQFGREGPTYVCDSTKPGACPGS